jgi:hypothetical protein
MHKRNASIAAASCYNDAYVQKAAGLYVVLLRCTLHCMLTGSDLIIPQSKSGVISSYCRICNLIIISKLLERLFLAFRHSSLILVTTTKTNLPIAVTIPQRLLSHMHLDSLVHSSDCGKSTLLVSLDLSAAVDTMDHSILLCRLQHSFGFSRTVHQ